MGTLKLEAIGRFKDYNTIDDVLCLATLIAVMELEREASVADANNYWKSISEDCGFCVHCNKCLAYIRHE